METKHTPVPWKTNPAGSAIGPEDWNDTAENPRLPGNLICAMPYCDSPRHADENKANAAFIVRACNSHADLYQACKLLSEAADIWEINDARDAARAALAEADGKAVQP